MGKYSKFKGQMTTLAVEPDYQSRVNARKDEIKAEILRQGRGINLKSIGNVYRDSRIEKKRLEALEKDQNLSIEATQQMLVEMMESAEFTKVTLDAGVTISIKDDVNCKVENRPLFHNWIKETGMEDLLTVNYQTMNALVKNRLIDGEELPPGIETYFRQSIQIRGINNDDEE